jgi:hypothetical protein
MGTHFHFDQMLPASDSEARQHPNSQRQVEILIPSGTREIHLRVGELDQEHQGNGYAVLLKEEDAFALFKSLESAMFYLGYNKPA